MANVCILTSVHPPFDTRIFHKEAKSLVMGGHDVSLVVQHGNNEVVEGIRIETLPRPKNRLERFVRTAWQIYRKALAIDADVYHFHDPELIPIGLLLKFHGKKVIYDVHEDVPRQILSKYYVPKLIRHPAALAMSVVEWLIAFYCSAILPATPKIAERFPARKTTVIHNFPIPSEFLMSSSTPYIDRPRAFAYPGVLATIRGVVEMVRALEYLKDIPSARLELAGEFSPLCLEDDLRALPGWASVNYHGWVSRGALAQVLCGVRAGLVLHHPVPNEIDAQPIKMFEYMAASLPIIASDFPLWRHIINEAGCGLMVDPLNPKAIADAMRWILDHPSEAEAMGRRGRRAMEEKYNWDTEAVKLLDLYRKVLSA